MSRARLDLSALVGPEVAAVLTTLDAEIAAVTAITSLPSIKRDRATFRVALADGRVLKARRCRTAARARRFAQLLPHVAHVGLPGLLVVEGRVTLEPWVDGTPLTALPPRAGRIRHAARMLAGLHGRCAGVRWRAAASVLPMHERTVRYLSRLRAAGALTAAEERGLRRVIDAEAPDRAAFGVTHNDFCAENLVEDAEGRLVAVDNEGLRSGFLDFDLARTWYRWPMSASLWAAFLDGYARGRDPASFVRYARFWKIAALAKGAAVRFRRTDGADVPLAGLRLFVPGVRGRSARMAAGHRSGSRRSR